MARELTTERMHLRPVTEDDAPLLFALDSDPEVMRWLSGGPATPIATIRDVVIPGFLAGADDAFGCLLASEGDEFAGWVNLRRGGTPAEGAELGYRFRREIWGRGLATEAARAVIDRAFREFEVTRIFGTTYEENLGSRRVMEKLGMTPARRFRPSSEDLASSSTFAPGAGDAWPGDDLEYAITRADWR